MFLKLIEEKYDRFLTDYTLVSGDFLSLEEQSRAARFMLSHKSDGAVFWGGYEDAERCMPLFVPDYILSFLDASGIDNPKSSNAGTGVHGEPLACLYSYFIANPDDCPISVLDIKVPRQEKIVPGHRDYLGALMGLGIKREKTGDIIVHPDGAQIIVVRDLASYIRDSLTSVGRVSVNIEIKGIDSIDTGAIRTEELSLNVASPRLDNVISAVFNLSRKSAVEAIGSGLVFVSGLENTKPDYQLKSEQKIVLRHKGKAVYHGVTGTSKKGKSYISVTKYI